MARVALRLNPSGLFACFHSTNDRDRSKKKTCEEFAKSNGRRPVFGGKAHACYNPLFFKFYWIGVDR